MKQILLLAMLVTVTSCFQNRTVSKSEAGDSVVYLSKGILQNNCKVRIVDNDFVYQPLGEEVSFARIKKMLSGNYDTYFKARVDKYDTEKLDTVVIFKSEKSELVFIKLREDEDISIMESAFISDRLIELDRGICIGMKKEEFVKLFDISITECDSILVDSEDQTFENWFIFKNDTLYSITWGSNL